MRVPFGVPRLLLSAVAVAALLAATPGAAQTQTIVLSPTIATAELKAAQHQCLFRWAEEKYPTHLRAASPATQTTAAYIYRHYEKSNTYLGIGAGDGHLYFYAPDTDRSGPLDLGLASAWIEQSGCTDPYAEIATPFDTVAVAAICSPTDPAQNCVETHPKAIRVDDESRFDFVRTDYDAAAGIFKAELKSGAALDPRFEAGAFIYRSRKDRAPLVHRIDALKQEGQLVVMTVSRAQAKEVFPRARIRARIPFGDSASATSARNAAPRASTQPFGLSDCSGNVFDKSFADSGGAGGVAVQGSVTFDLTSCHFLLQAWVDATLEWDTWGVNVDKVEVSVGGGVDAAMDTKLQLDITGAYSTQKSIWTGPVQVVPVGPILITITPELFAGYSTTGKANLTSLQGFTWTDEITIGLGYNDYDKWYSIDKRNNTFTHYGPDVTFDANVTAKPWLEFQANIEVFDVVGGTISLEGFAEAKLTGHAEYVNNELSGDMCASLDVGLTPRAGVIVELLGMDIFAKDWPLHTFRKNVVEDACVAYTGARPSIPADADPNRSSCFFDSQCSPTNPNDSTLQAKCKKGGQLSSGLYQYACETIIPDDYCQPGSAYYVCESVSFTGKTADKLTPTCNADTHRCEIPFSENALQAGVMAASQGLSQAQQASVDSLDAISPVAAAAATCVAPACCRDDSDCRDGDIWTTDTCEKPMLSAKGGSLGACKSVSKSK